MISPERRKYLLDKWKAVLNYDDNPQQRLNTHIILEGQESFIPKAMLIEPQENLNKIDELNNVENL